MIYERRSRLTLRRYPRSLFVGSVGTVLSVLTTERGFLRARPTNCMFQVLGLAPLPFRTRRQVKQVTVCISMIGLPVRI
jgi:hypothetical protein